ncbi:unnamed protein product [Symbiodinium pilosum]|uniref:Uncharacterized protein n=1 Tax=Symbiodinium pilosum TaxID=2952 RepID=A0A812V769_SYMPI|nr:unnamed protein product [Symbiodinium pilosum]
MGLVRGFQERGFEPDRRGDKYAQGTNRCPRRLAFEDQEHPRHCKQSWRIRQQNPGNRG